MGIGDLRENIYVHASPKCERRISMEHVSPHPAICTNVFKNGDATTSKAAFTRKWIEMINRIEKKQTAPIWKNTMTSCFLCGIINKKQLVPISKGI